MASEVLEELDLSQGTLRENLLAENIGDFLDGHAIACLAIGGRAVQVLGSEHALEPMYIPDNTVCTLSELFRHSVSVVDDEVLVKDLEDLAACEITHGGFCGK